MPDLIEPTPPSEHDAPDGLMRKLGWFAAIALMSATAVAVAAYALKALLPAPL